MIVVTEIQEWGMSLNHKYIGGFRLEMDQTWTPLDRIGDVDEKKRITKSLLQSSNLTNIFQNPELMDAS